jgi:hypothetical protein
MRREFGCAKGFMRWKVAIVACQRQLIVDKRGSTAVERMPVDKEACGIITVDRATVGVEEFDPIAEGVGRHCKCSSLE